MKLILALLSMAMPWPLRRWMLIHTFKFEIHPSSRIGFSFVLPNRLVMEAHSRIGNLNVLKGLDIVKLSTAATIGNLNWITGFPLGASRHFSHQPHRQPELILGAHAAVSNRHLIDCTARVTIGEYSIVGGFASQILTHSVDMEAARQSSCPVMIGDHCFIGTNCIILPESVLPDHCVLGAKSLLNKSMTESYCLYAGVPAQKVKSLDQSMAYFKRDEGFIW